MIPVNLVFLRKDARPIDEAAVGRLADSIAEVGLINPLQVRRARRFVDGIESDAYELIAGAHRLAAVKRLGHETVNAIVVTTDDLRAELAMIDENLMRSELGQIDRSKSVKRRSEIFELLHPDTKAGVAGASARWNDDANEIISFAKATSEATGQTARNVQLLKQRGEKITDEAAELIRGTELDKTTFLDKLKNVPPEKQVERVLADLENAEKRKEMEKRNKDADRVIEITCAQQFAEWILERSDLQELDVVISWLQGAKVKDVISALRREAA